MESVGLLDYTKIHEEGPLQIDTSVVHIRRFTEDNSAV
jgi:hypothetical protein